MGRTVTHLLISLGVGLAVGMTVIAITRPSTDEIQRAALEEIGLAPELESAPFVGPVIDELTDRVTDRVVDESRTSAIGGLGGAVTAAVAVHLALERRRSSLG